MVVRVGKVMVAKDAKPLVYEDIVVGQELPTIEMVTNQELQGRFLTALQDDNPWYSRESPWRGPVVHHAMLNDLPICAAMQIYEWPFGSVHAKQETEFINPVPLGKRLTAHSKIVEKYVRRGKQYIAMEALVVDEDGVPIMRSKIIEMIGDERVREAVKSGLKHVPPPPSL